MRFQGIMWASLDIMYVNVLVAVLYRVMYPSYRIQSRDTTLVYSL